jgi:GIY-YIG catalytic domain
MTQMISIYRIINDVTGDFYLGSSIHTKRRFREHLTLLKSNRHQNLYLQRAWNKYGEKAFRFEIYRELFGISSDDLRTVEQHYLDTLKPEYNLSTEAVYPAPSPEAIARRGEKFSKEYYVMSPNGVGETIRNLSAFARSHGLSAGCLNRVSQGEGRQHRGWRVRPASAPDWLFREKQRFVFIDPTNVVYESSRVNDFAEERDLDYKCLLGVINGSRYSCNGWRAFRVGAEHKMLHKPRNKQWRLVSPDGEEVLTDNLNAFSREKGLNVYELRRVAKGRREDYRGWRCSIIGETHPPFRSHMGKEYIVTSPDGIEQKIQGLKPFCLVHGLEHRNMSAVAQGRDSHHRGWKCRHAEDNAPRYVNRLTKQWIVTNPDGEEKLIDNLALFCRLHGLDKRGMQSVAYGRVSCHQGWRCRYATDVLSHNAKQAR